MRRLGASCRPSNVPLKPTAARYGLAALRAALLGSVRSLALSALGGHGTLIGLREWTGWRIIAAWALWVILAAGGALAAAVTYALTHQPGPGRIPHAADPAIISPVGTITLDGGLVLGVLLGPPVLLSAAWLWQRRRRP